MITEFALDLRHARRKSGLSQQDVGHLLSINQSTYSDFERGKIVPSLEQICQLSLIYGRSFQSYFERITSGVKPRLAERLEELPVKQRLGLRVFNRGRTLGRLRLRLKPLSEAHDSS